MVAASNGATDITGQHEIYFFLERLSVFVNWRENNLSLFRKEMGTGLGKSLPSPQIPFQGFVGWDMGVVGFMRLLGLAIIYLKYFLRNLMHRNNSTIEEN